MHQEGTIGWSSLSLKEDKKHRALEERGAVPLMRVPYGRRLYPPPQSHLLLRHESVGTEGPGWEVERQQGEQMELNPGRHVACTAAADRPTCLSPP